MASARVTRPSHPALYAVTSIAIVAVAWSLAVPAASAAAAAGEPVRAGDVVVVDSNDGSQALTHGKSETEFSLRLPQGAACPGDSANDQWRFQSFMIPAADALGTLHYNVGGPDGPGQYPLFQVSTSPMVDGLTNQNTRPGEPGVIPAIPPLSFGAFPPGLLPSGTYRIGIACTLSRQTAMYWDTEVVITSSASDRPSQFVWRLPDVPESVNASNSGSSSWLLLVGVSALGVVALAWFLRPRPARSAMNSRRAPATPGRRAAAAKASPRTPDNNVKFRSSRRAVTHSKESK